MLFLFLMKIINKSGGGNGQLQYKKAKRVRTLRGGISAQLHGLSGIVGCY